MSADYQFDSLGLELPPTPRPMGVYRPIVISGNLAFLSGHGPVKPDGELITGRLGLNLDIEAGYAAAKLTGLGMLMTLRHDLGTLNRIRRVVKILGLVRSTDRFSQQPDVINGCSELFKEVFGDAGVGARSAIGVNALPSDMAVEIEGIFEIDP